MNSRFGYADLAAEVRTKIFSLQYEPGEKIPPMRCLAAMYKCTPLTVQRALNVLSQERLIIGKQGVGHFVTTNTDLIDQRRNLEIEHLSVGFLTKMRAIGCPDSVVLKLIAKMINSQG